MERRDFINSIGLSAAAMAALGSSTAFASATHNKHQRKKLKPSGISQDKLDKVIAAAQECVKNAEICNAHCITQLAQGSKMMAECQLAVQNTLAVCRSMITVAAVDSLDKGLMQRYISSRQDF